MVQHVTSKELDRILKESTQTVFCDFWATWCGPCRMLAPVYEEISVKYDGKAIFLKLDVDQNEEAAIKYSISSIPNIIAFKNGAPVSNSLGFVPPDALEAFVQKNL